MKSTPALADLHHRDTGTPTYDGLPLGRYVSLFEMLNPMHRLWADGRWNKLTVARGCYWKQCTFCDVSLDYIARYEPASADVTVDRIEALMRETGETGFHFVDEAAPPAMLRALAQRLIERRVAITWWGNIRFEKNFTPELVELLARSGLRRDQRRAGGGVGSPAGADEEGRHGRAGGAGRARVHRRGRDGARVPDVRLPDRDRAGDGRRARAGAPAVRRGVHPVGVLAPVRRHGRTARSAASPTVYGIRLARAPAVPARRMFARNEVPFVDPTGCDHERFGPGLRRALYNFMHGVGLDEDVRSWFAPEAGAPARRTPRQGACGGDPEAAGSGGSDTPRPGRRGWRRRQRPSGERRVRRPEGSRPRTSACSSASVASSASARGSGNGSARSASNVRNSGSAARRGTWASPFRNSRPRRTRPRLGSASVSRRAGPPRARHAAGERGAIERARRRREPHLGLGTREQTAEEIGDIGGAPARAADDRRHARDHRVADLVRRRRRGRQVRILVDARCGSAFAPSNSPR